MPTILRWSSNERLSGSRWTTAILGRSAEPNKRSASYSAWLAAVHPRHHVVEQDHIRLKGCNFFQRLDAVAGSFKPIVIIHEFLLEQIEIERLVVNDEDFIGHKFNRGTF